LDKPPRERYLQQHPMSRRSGSLCFHFRSSACGYAGRRDILRLLVSPGVSTWCLSSVALQFLYAPQEREHPNARVGMNVICLLLHLKDVLLEFLIDTDSCLAFEEF
jgi:hypothetical protein